MGANELSKWQNANERPEGITRRTFLAGGGATVASMMLPCLGTFGGKVAYAQEFTAAGEGESASEPTTQIIVLSYNEIGLSVYDVNEEGATAPVPNARVSISATVKDKTQTLEAVSDENGAVVFDASKLGTAIDLGTMGRCYRFEGSVTITKEHGYRNVTLEKIRVDSGSALKIPCCKIRDASIPYFESLSFNGWDMQYGECEVIRCEAATDKIALTGTLRMEGVDSVEVSLWTRDLGEDGKRASSPLFTATVSMYEGVGRLSRSAYYLRLLAPTKDLLPLKKAFEIQVTAGDLAYVFPVNLSVKESDIPLSTGNADIVPGVSYGQTGSEHTWFTLPDSFPAVLRGSSFTMWVPTLPVDFYISPFGIMFLGIGVTGERSASSINGFRAASFSNETNASVKQQWKDLNDRWSKKIDQYKDMRKGTDPGSSKVFGHQLSTSFGISGSVEATLFAECNWLESTDAIKFMGQAAAIFDLYMYVSLVEQLTIGPVPFFIGINVSLDARLSFYATIESPKGEPLDIDLVPEKTGIAIVVNVELALSLGVGLSGVISASLRGAGSLSMYFALLEATEDIVPGAPRHVVIGAGIEVAIVLQALVFKWSGKIWSTDWPRLYDNWKASSNEGGLPSSYLSNDYALGTDSNGAGVFASDALVDENGAVKLEEFGKIATIVTSSELLKSREAAAKATTRAFAAPEAAEPIDLGNGMFAMPFNVAAPDASEDALSEGEDGYVYEDVGEDPQGVCTGFADIASIAPSGGVVPSKDVKIISASFSNPREKVITYDGIVYLFRLMSVDYSVDGTHEGRTRLSAQIYNAETGRWGRPKVLDIPVSLADVDRADMFDYDFDVCTQTEMSASLYQGIYVSLVSTVRANGDQTTFFDASSESILTAAAFNRDLKRLWSSMWKETPGSTPANAYTVTCPRITTIMKNGRPLLVALGYLQHAADSPMELFSDNATTTCRVAVPLSNNLVHTAGVPVDATANSLEISSIDVDDQDESVGSFSLVSHSRNGVSVATVKLAISRKLQDASPEEELDVLRAPQSFTFSAVRNIVNAADVSDMRAWPGHASFLSLVNGELYEASFDPSVEKGSLSTRPVGPASAKMSAFKVSDNGNVLFFMENKEGKKEQSFDEHGNPIDSPTENRYRVLASLYVDGLFSEPFPLAGLTHPIDSIVGVSGRDVYTFVTSAITSMENSTADLHYVEVPIVATASILGFAAEELFVLQGESTTFDIVLRNDGNVILTGCVASLHDQETGEKVAESTLAFAAENACASAWNPELATEVIGDEIANGPAYSDDAVGYSGVEGFHRLADPVSAGVLLPGKTSQYRVEFAIPSDWHGTKSVYAVVSDFSYETIVSMAPDGMEASPISHDPDHDELPGVSIDVIKQQSDVFDPGLSEPEVRVVKDGVDVGPGASDGGQDGSDDGQGGGSNGAGGSSGDSQLGNFAQTGDGAGVPFVGALAGAAAAAFVAYSARRAALEQGEWADSPVGLGQGKSCDRDRDR